MVMKAMGRSSIAGELWQLSLPSPGNLKEMWKLRLSYLPHLVRYYRIWFGATLNQTIQLC